MSLNTEILVDSPVHYLRLDDASGLGFLSQDGSSAVTWLNVDGDPVNSLDQNDSNNARDMIEPAAAGVTESLANLKSGFCLFKIRGSTQKGNILYTRIDANNALMWIITDPGELRLDFKIAGVDHSVRAVHRLIDEVTYALGYTIEGTNVILYVNGLPVDVIDTTFVTPVLTVTRICGLDDAMAWRNTMDEFAAFSTEIDADRHKRYAKEAGYLAGLRNRTVRGQRPVLATR